MYERMYHEKVEELHKMQTERDELKKELDGVSTALTEAGESMEALAIKLAAIEKSFTYAGGNLPENFKIITMHDLERSKWELKETGTILIENIDGTLYTHFGATEPPGRAKALRWGMII